MISLLQNVTLSTDKSSSPRTQRTESCLYTSFSLFLYIQRITDYKPHLHQARDRSWGWETPTSTFSAFNSRTLFWWMSQWSHPQGSQSVRKTLAFLPNPLLSKYFKIHLKHPSWLKEHQYHGFLSLSEGNFLSHLELISIPHSMLNFSY